MDRDKAAPLIGRDLPEFERALPAVRPDRTGADPGIVDQDIDPAKPGACRSGDLVGGRIRCQIGLDGEELVCLSLLARARRKRPQRITVAIDAGDPDARRQQAPHHGPADTARRPGHDRHSLRLAHGMSPPLDRPPFYLGGSPGRGPAHPSRTFRSRSAGHLRERVAVDPQDIESARTKTGRS